MSKSANKPTNSTQKIIIGLICAVALLLIGQLMLGKSGNELPPDRESCLASGNIWSNSSQRCFEAGHDPNSATTAMSHEE